MYDLPNGIGFILQIVGRYYWVNLNEEVKE